jgi:HD superfamily phosphohydrolase
MGWGMNISKKFILSFVTLCSFGFFTKNVDLKNILNFVEQKPSISLKTIYGNFEITEPIVIELLNHPMLKRLEKIRQYGVSYYAVKPETYDRLEHSIGVYVLLKKYGASLNEQVAGLLHDVSHTVFSHVGEWVFDHKDGLSSYQDDNHDQFIKDSGLADVLKKYNLDVSDINHKFNDFKRLEQDLPDLCLDRIEYNLQGGLREGLIDKQDLTNILHNLKFKDGRWYFTNLESAKKFGLIALYHTEWVWGNPLGLVVYMLTGQALKIALNKGLLHLDDIRFGEDDAIWQRLTTFTDPEIQELLFKINHYKDYYAPAAEQADFYVHAKFRGTNPLVEVGDKLYRLTELDADYARCYDRLKEIYKQPLGVKRLK